MQISDALKMTRKEMGKSQEDMAYEMGVARRTVQNWEKGVTEPSIGQAVQWFELLEINPLPYLIQYVFPDMEGISSTDDDEQIKKSVLSLIEQMPIESIRQILYICYGDHGSSPRGILNLVTAHLQLPMQQRIMDCGLVVQNYELAQKQGKIAKPDNIQPNIPFLKSMLAQAEHAVLHGNEKYSSTSKHIKIT